MLGSADVAEPDLLAKIPDLIRYLRLYEYQVGLNDELRVEALCDELRSRGEAITRIDALERILAPLVCRNADEQERLPRVLNRWLGTAAGRQEKLQKPNSNPKSSGGARSWTRLRVFGIAVLVALFMGALVVFFYESPSNVGNSGGPSGPLIPSNVHPGSANSTESTQWAVYVAIVLAPLPAVLGFLIFWLRQRRQAITRGESPRDAASRALHIDIEQSPVFRPGAIQSALRDLRRHKLLLSMDLDIGRTIAVTARSGGFVQFVRARRSVLPDYLLLSDRASARDHFGDLGRVLATRLHLEKLRVTHGEYFGDPRCVTLFGENGNRSEVELTRLSTEQPWLRLLLFADVSDFWDVDGRRRDWVDSLLSFESVAVLTPIPRFQWGAREQALVELGFRIVPATSQGITDLAQQMYSESAGGYFDSSSQSVEKLDAMLEATPYLWSGNKSPPEGKAEELIGSLHKTLGRGAFLHLCAIAVFPAVNPRLTEHVGALLTLADGSPAMTEEGYAAMARLPWLRQARIPDWLRKSLIESMPSEDASRVRSLWINLLAREPVSTEQGVTFDVADGGATPAAVRRVLRALAMEQDCEFVEKILLAFLAGHQLPNLALTAPSRLGRWRLPTPDWVDYILFAGAAAVSAVWLWGGGAALVAIAAMVEGLPDLLKESALLALGGLVFAVLLRPRERFILYHAWVRFPLIGVVARFSRMTKPSEWMANQRLDRLFRAYHRLILQPLLEAKFSRPRSHQQSVNLYNWKVEHANASLDALLERIRNSYPALRLDRLPYARRVERFEKNSTWSNSEPESPPDTDIAPPPSAPDFSPLPAARQLSLRARLLLLVMPGLVPEFALLARLIEVPAQILPLAQVAALLVSLLIFAAVSRTGRTIQRMKLKTLAIVSALTFVLGLPVLIFYLGLTNAHLIHVERSGAIENFVIPFTPSAQLSEYVAPYGGFADALAASPNRDAIAALMAAESVSVFAAMLALLVVAQVLLVGGAMTISWRLASSVSRGLDASARPDDDIAALAKGGRTNFFGFVIRLLARIPFLFIAGQLYGPSLLGRFAYAVIVVELAAQLATLGLKRGLAQQLSTTDKPHSHVIADGLLCAFIASTLASALLMVFPQAMFPQNDTRNAEFLLPLVIFGIAGADIALAALAYKHDVKSTVHVRAIVEPWVISIAAGAFFYTSFRNDGLILAYVASVVAGLVAALWRLFRSYGRAKGWRPYPGSLIYLARRNVPWAAADAIEWFSRRLDIAILGLFVAPQYVGIYYVAQQVASMPQKLKTSFDPILAPVVTQKLAEGDKKAVAKQVMQVGFWIIAAQAGIALALGIPGEALMGLFGKEGVFVGGTAALAFLLAAEVVAATAAVSEAALVYVARHRNLMISCLMIATQAALTVGIIFAMRSLPLTDSQLPAWQAAGAALGLALALGMASILKSRLLARLLGASVQGWRWSLILAGVAASAVGFGATLLPEWLELSVGAPAILITFGLVVWYRGFTDDDRTLFRFDDKEKSELSVSESATP